MWYMANEGEHVFLCDQYHAKLNKVIEAAVFRTHNVEPENLTNMYTKILAFGPVGNRDEEVKQASDKEEKAINKAITDELVANSRMAQAMINHEVPDPRLYDEDRGFNVLGEDDITPQDEIYISPSGRKGRKVKVGDKGTVQIIWDEPKAPSTSKPRIVRGSQPYTLASGKVVTIDSSGKVTW